MYTSGKSIEDVFFCSLTAVWSSIWLFLLAAFVGCFAFCLLLFVWAAVFFRRYCTLYSFGYTFAPVVYPDSLVSSKLESCVHAPDSCPASKVFRECKNEYLPVQRVYDDVSCLSGDTDGDVWISLLYVLAEDFVVFYASFFSFLISAFWRYICYSRFLCFSSISARATI